MTISTNIEIPEELHTATQEYLDQHPDWDQGRIVQAALSLFLLQNGAGAEGVNELYLESLFGCDS